MHRDEEIAFTLCSYLHFCIVASLEVFSYKPIKHEHFLKRCIDSMIEP